MLRTIAAFDPPQPTMGADGGLRRVSFVPQAATAGAALTHPTLRFSYCCNCPKLRKSALIHLSSDVYRTIKALIRQSLSSSGSKWRPALGP